MSILDAPIARLDGTPTTLGEITGGRPALLVNVASKCGLTPQYAGLEELQETYGDAGFTVVGLPCNQFMGQEPGIGRGDRGVLLGDVRRHLPDDREDRGQRRRPARDLRRRWSTRPNEKGEAGDVTWNFEKFLVDADGTVVARFSPRVDARGPALVDAVARPWLPPDS